VNLAGGEVRCGEIGAVISSAETSEAVKCSAPGGSGYIRARMGREVPGNVTYISRPTPVQYSNNSDLQQTTVTMTHVDDKHHVTLDRLTKVTAMTRVFNLHPASS